MNTKINSLFEPLNSEDLLTSAGDILDKISNTTTVEQKNKINLNIHELFVLLTCIRIHYHTTKLILRNFG